MPKFKELTRGEKFFKAATVTSGFIAGSVLGGAISGAMKEGGWDSLTSNIAGIAAVAVYTKVFDWAADSAIVSRRLSKIDEARLKAVNDLASFSPEKIDALLKAIEGSADGAKEA